MKPFRIVLLLVFLSGISGCVHSISDLGANRQNSEWEESGWPFRWEITQLDTGTRMTRVMVDLPSGPTKADDKLKAAILHEISKSWWHQNVYPAKLEEVRVMPDGREVWILEEPKKTSGRAHVVTINPDAKPSHRFKISGLIAFDRSSETQKK